MANHLFFSDDDQSEAPISAFCWWRTPQDFDDDGHFKADVAVLSALTPRFKVLRELERLAFIAAEGLEDFRHKLLNYRAGAFWLPVGGMKKEEMDIPPLVTLLLTGMAGSGKSSLVNLMYSVLGRSGLIPFAQTSGEGSTYSTMFLEEHDVLRSPRNGFCVYDTRGLEEDRMGEGLEQVSAWMSSGVRHNQPCFRQGDGTVKGLVALSGSVRVANSRYVRRKVNCVMVVADLSQLHRGFKDGDFKSIQALKDIFNLSAVKSSNENPILILTHGDTLSAEERVNGRLKICEYLGIPETSGAYDIPCLTEQGILTDPVTAFALTEAVYRALLQADRTHLPKRSYKEWIVLFLSGIMWYIASFFAVLAHFFSKFGHHDSKLKL